MPRFSECWRCGKKDSSLMCAVCNVATYCSRKCKESDQARHKTDCGAAAVLKTCSTCGERSSTLKSCSSCLRAFYCDSECQKKDWPTHMTRCKEAEKKIKSIAEQMEFFYLVRDSGMCITIKERYYWGNSPAFDCLNLKENEGSQIRNMNILFLGVGDLRNVALSCASLPESHEIDIKFTLNDIDCFTLARLVLLLYMLTKGESGIEKSITEIWYSVLLSEQSYTTLCTYLRELTDIPNSAVLKLNTNGLVSIDENHLKEMKFVWKTWLSLRVKKTTWMQEQRQKMVDGDAGSEAGKRNYYNSIPSEHVKSTKKWMKDGVFSSTKSPLVAENPTLTGPQPTSADGPFSYCCRGSSLPFSGWDYLQVKKFKHCDSIVTMYGAYIQDVLQRFKLQLATKHVTFQVILGDCVEIDRFLDPGVKFDRILTSNLIDYISIPRLLKLCSTMLNHGNPYSTIVTETHNWTQDFCKDADGAFVMGHREFELMSAAMEDTHNSSLVKRGGGTSVREYHDNSAEFMDYLRASFRANFTKEEQSKETKRRKLPIAKELGNAFGLRLRDYARNENRLVFFKLAVNCRRVTMIAGVERTLEWVPM